MGHQISSLARFPTSLKYKIYIFVVYKHGWHGGLESVVRQNFSKLAKEIGPDAAIVQEHEGQDWMEELVYALSRRQDVHQTVGMHAYSAGPGLLIMNAHPEKLTDKDMVLYVPLAHVRDMVGGLEAFFDELCDFCVDGDPKFVEKFSEATIFSGKQDLVARANEIIVLKPAIFGVGVNLNAAVTAAREAWKKRKGGRAAR